MKPTSSPVPDEHTISLTVLLLITDARKRKRVLARRGQSFAATPESFAALPGHLNSLVRGVGGDALLELSKLLALLAQPEPPAAEPPPALVCPPPPSCVVPEPEIPVAEVPSAPVQNPEGLADDYLLALDVTLLGTLP